LFARLTLALLAALRLLAHDAPKDVKVHIHLQPSGGTLQCAVRIPLKAVRDIDFPSQANGYLDIAKLAPLLPGLAKIWIADPLSIQESASPLPPPRIVGTQISVESDRSFASFAEAAAHIRQPLPPNSENLSWEQVYFDALLEYHIASPNARFAIRPAYAGLAERVTTALRFGDRTYLLPGDQELFPLDPSWTQAAWRFVHMGFEHILDGKDHLLFLLCLVIPVRQFRALFWVVTAFTAAHSITLLMSAFGMAPEALWFPPLVEFGIALSIVFMALANIVGKSGRGNWAIAFGFGLIHGFGFSFALRESMQFAGAHLVSSLLAFNAGVELGQIAALALMLPCLSLLFRHVVEERTGTIVLSAIVAHTGWHWMEERGEVLLKFNLSPAQIASTPGLATWLAIGLAAVGVGWLARRRTAR
jgi:hypothetical protein